VEQKPDSISLEIEEKPDLWMAAETTDGFASLNISIANDKQATQVLRFSSCKYRHEAHIWGVFKDPLLLGCGILKALRLMQGHNRRTSEDSMN
jgi:hypothetical protein